MRGRGRQLADGAVVGLIIGGDDKVPGRQEVVTGKVLVRCHVGAGVKDRYGEPERGGVNGSR
jgi:hypothetical protein